MDFTATNRKPALPVFLSDIATLSVALLLPVGVGTRTLSLSDLLAAGAISAASLLLGRTLADAMRLPRLTGFSLAFEVVVGLAWLSLILLVMQRLLHANATMAFLITGAILLPLSIWRGRRTTDGLRGNAAPAGVERFMLVAISAVVALWTHSSLDAAGDAEKSGVFRAWTDYFIHATEIRYARDFTDLFGQSPTLADTAQYTYHRASYMLPAVFAAISGRTTLQVATCFWQPLGMLLMGLGAYGYAAMFAGATSGVVAVVALFLIPDGAIHGLHNGFFGFQWLLGVAPASGYCVGVVLMAFAVYFLRPRLSRAASTVFAGALVFSAVGFKAQIAVPATMLYGVLLLVDVWPNRIKHRVALIGSLAAIAVVAVLLMERIKLAPHFLSGVNETTKFYTWVHSLPSAYREIYPRITAHAGPFAQTVTGMLFLVMGAFGLILPAAAIVTMMRVRSGRTGLIEYFPFALLAAYLATMIVMPVPANGDPGEYKHRPFVLIYAALVVTSVAGLADLVAASKPSRAMIVGGRAVLAAASVAGLVFAWKTSQNIQFLWKNGTDGTVISAGQFHAASYVRTHASTPDRLQTSDGDPLAIIAALSECTSFLSRVPNFQALGGQLGEVAEQRKGLLDELRAIETYDRLVSFGRTNRIRWFILNQVDAPNWNREIRSHAMLNAGDTLVFDLK